MERLSNLEKRRILKMHNDYMHATHMPKQQESKTDAPKRTNEWGKTSGHVYYQQPTSRVIQQQSIGGHFSTVKHRGRWPTKLGCAYQVLTLTRNTSIHPNKNVHLIPNKNQRIGILPVWMGGLNRQELVGFGWALGFVRTKAKSTITAQLFRIASPARLQSTKARKFCWRMNSKPPRSTKRHSCDLQGTTKDAAT